MKKTISFTAYITLEVDTENQIVKEYEDLSELVGDVLDYRFSNVLPVINEGAVNVDSIEFEDITEC